MLILRVCGILVLITVVACLALYAITRQRRYLGYAWRTLLFAVILVVLVMAFYAAERLLLVV